MKAKKEYTETIMHSCGHEVEYKTLGYKMNGKGKTFDSVRQVSIKIVIKW